MHKTAVIVYKLCFYGSMVRSDQTVLKWNAPLLRTGSVQNGPAHGSEPFSSPAPVDQSAFEKCCFEPSITIHENGVNKILHFVEQFR